MDKPWFANRGQLLQAIVAITGLLLAAVNAWPAIRALDILSVPPFIFFASLLLIAVLIWQNKTQRPRELGGISRFYTAWAGMDNEDWLRQQKELFIFLKDGKRFFEERQRALADERDDPLFDRLTDRRKSTHIVILHPNYCYIDAVATMDPIKAQNPSLQVEDCVVAIRTMQDLAMRAMSRGIDITKRNTFRGYHHIPTYNAMFGDKEAYINYYYSRPFRGDLISFKCEVSEHENLYDQLLNDLKEMLRDNNTTSLWSFERAS